MNIQNVSMIALTAALFASGAWAQVMQSGEPGVAAEAGPVEAAVALPLDGAWLTYDVSLLEGEFFPDNWDFTNTEPVTVQVTDWLVVTDAFEVYDNGFLEFLTSPESPAPNWDDLGFASPFDSPPWTDDPDTAWNTPVFSKGWMTFEPGSHSITIRNTQIPPVSVGGSDFPDSTVAIRATIVPGCDIKPGSFPNSINISKKQGVIPVALLGSENVNVADIDVSTLTFEGAYPDHDLSDPWAYAGHLEDVNFDGYADLVSHYRAQETMLHGASTEGVIEGLIGGVPFSCADSVRIVGGN